MTATLQDFRFSQRCCWSSSLLGCGAIFVGVCLALKIKAARPSKCWQLSTERQRHMSEGLHRPSHGLLSANTWQKYNFNVSPPPLFCELNILLKFQGEFLWNCRGPCLSCNVSEAVLLDSVQAAKSCDRLFTDDSSDIPHTFVFAIRSSCDATWHLHSCECLNQSLPSFHCREMLCSLWGTC